MRKWFKRAPVRTVQAYVAAFNARDLKTLSGFIADDIVLIDSAGGEARGQAAARKVFTKLFAEAAILEVLIDRYSYSSGQVLLTGRIVSDHPAISDARHFRVRADDSLIYEWQSYSAHPVHTIARILAGANEFRPSA